MSRFPRLRRSPDQWRDAHERARVRAAERLDGPLGLVESQWLDEHLAGCADCSAVAAAYAADRQTLRALRDDHPEPPRDLWARTAATIEQLSLRSEDGTSRPDPADRGPSPAGQLRRLPLSAMTTVAVVVVVFGATLLMNGAFAPPVGPQTAGSPGIALASSSAAPGRPGAEATPYAVKAGQVAWVVDAGSGGVSYSTHQVEEVCPQEGSANCAPLPDEGSTKLALDAAPRTLIGSPSRKQAVAISKTATAGDKP